MVERYCGVYDGEQSHDGSVSVADANATTSDLEDDVDPESPSLSAFSSWTAETRDVIAP